MKKVVYALLLLSCAAGAFVAGAVLSHRKAGAASERQVLYWHDPMHPSYKSDKPGIAPDCGMQLEPVYADGQPAVGSGMAAWPAGTVQLGEDKQQLIGVRLAEVQKGQVQHTLRLYGRVVPDETRVYTVNAALDGYLRDVAPVTTGSQVRKNQWLATFFALEARAPINAYLSSLDVLERAGRRDPKALEIRNAEAIPDLNIERMRAVGVTEAQIAEIYRTRQIPTTVRILSPVDGFVLARNVSRNQKFEQGAEWFRIADLRRVWVLADVYEAEADSLKPGTEVALRLPGSGKRRVARVADVLPQFDAASRSFKVRLEADNPDFVLRPDMFVDVELPLSLPSATLVPLDALVDTGLRKTVFVERASGTFVPRSVETGRRLGGQVEITRGLVPGERIVVAGTFLVDSESRMKAAAAGVFGTAAKDPVCGMDVDEAKAQAAGKTAQAGGKTFHFCSEECKHRFEASPSTYRKGHSHGHEHPHDVQARAL
jgi:RND family efflux transporter MFP subunit